MNKCSWGFRAPLSLCLCMCTKASIEMHTAQYNPVWMTGPVSITRGQRKTERRAPPLCHCFVGKIITRRLWMHVVPLRTQLLPWIGEGNNSTYCQPRCIFTVAAPAVSVYQKSCSRLCPPLHSSSECNYLHEAGQRGWDPIRNNFVWSLTLVLVGFSLEVVSNLGYFLSQTLS